MSTTSREIIEELTYLEQQRNQPGPMQTSCESLFRAKLVEHGPALIEAALECEALRLRLETAEQCLREARQLIGEIEDNLASFPMGER